MTALYSIGTWDTNVQAYTPQDGIGNCVNITRSELRTRIGALRREGYSVHRKGNARDGHYDDDSAVLIIRTDGKPEAKILEDWKR